MIIILNRMMGYVAVTIIEKAASYSGPDEIAGPVGQAHFFRAWHHFFLLQRFGGIPLMMSTPDVFQMWYGVRGHLDMKL